MILRSKSLLNNDKKKDKKKIFVLLVLQFSDLPVFVTLWRNTTLHNVTDLLESGVQNELRGSKKDGFVIFWCSGVRLFSTKHSKYVVYPNNKVICVKQGKSKGSLKLYKEKLTEYDYIDVQGLNIFYTYFGP